MIQKISEFIKSGLVNLKKEKKKTKNKVKKWKKEKKK